MTTVLSRDQVIAYVGANASKYGLDPAAVLAVANGEGLNHAPTHWVVPGEHLPSFGPPSWYAGGAGSTFMQHFGVTDADQAAKIAWSTDGLDYWLAKVAESGATGQTGLTAITTIVTHFERPAAQYVSGNINGAQQAYAHFQDLISTGGTDIPIGSGNTIVPVPDNAGAGGTLNPTVGGSKSGSQDVRLGTIGPLAIGIPSGLVLGLLGLALLLIGALLFVGGGQLRATMVQNP